jgi:type IV pilus assembly protein PilV
MMTRLSNAGFTLIEVLVSMVIFAIGLLAVAGMFMLQTRGNAFAGGASVANNLAIQRIEEVMNTPAASLAVTYPSAGTEYLTANGAACAAATSPPCYTRTMTYPAGGPAGTTAVRVNIGWVDQVGASHTFTMSTLRAP